MAHRSLWRSQGDLTGYGNVWGDFAFQQSFRRHPLALLLFLCGAWPIATRSGATTVWPCRLPLVRSPQGSRPRPDDGRHWFWGDDHAFFCAWAHYALWLAHGVCDSWLSSSAYF